MRPLEWFERKEDSSTYEEMTLIPMAEVADGFVIQELEMSGFMRYVDKTDPPIRFSEKFTVITGKTGAGKTSILDAITFALYKRTSRTDIQGIKITDICRKGGYVRLVFDQGGDRYEVTRGITLGGSTYLEVKKNGSAIEGKIPELEATIKDIIGLDYDGFRNSTFVRQEEMKQLGAERGSKRLEIFQKLFRLETFEKAAEVAKKKFSDARIAIEGEEREIMIRKEAVKKLPKLKMELEEREERLDFQHERLENTKRELLAAEEMLKRSESDHEEYLKLVNEINSRKRRVQEIDKKIKRKTVEAEEFGGLKERLRVLEAEVKDYDKLLKQREELANLRRKSSSMKEQLDLYMRQKERIKGEFEEKMEAISERVEECNRRIASLSTDIGAEEAFSLLRTEGSLNERIARIGKELEWLKDNKRIVGEIKAEREEAKKELKVVTRKVSRISVDSFTLSEIENRISELKEDLRAEKERYDASTKEIDKEIGRVSRRLEELGFGSEEEEKLRELESTVEALRIKKEELEEARKRLEEIGDISGMLKEYESQKELEEKELKKLESLREERKPLEEQYESNKKKVERLREAEKKLDIEIHGMRIKIEEVKRKIVELDNEAEKLREAERRTEELRERSEIYSLLKDKILHRKGVVMYAINQLLPTLEIETSHNLFELTDGRFSRVRLRTHEEERGYGIRIEVEGADGEWHDVAEFSGGERTQINAALRFAIAKELARMPQVGRTYGRMRTLFIDEGDLGSLDTEVNRDLFVQKLFKMGEFFDKIILITHITEVADKFQGQIRVHMTPEQESRIEILR